MRRLGCAKGKKDAINASWIVVTLSFQEQIRGVIEDPWKKHQKDVKRPNLDATEESQSTEQLQDEDNMADEEKEPTLSQIRDMLRDLQKSVAAILKENNNLKEELS